MLFTSLLRAACVFQCVLLTCLSFLGAHTFNTATVIVSPRSGIGIYCLDFPPGGGSRHMSTQAVTLAVYIFKRQLPLEMSGGTACCPFSPSANVKILFQWPIPEMSLILTQLSSAFLRRHIFPLNTLKQRAHLCLLRRSSEIQPLKAGSGRDLGRDRPAKLYG